MKIKITSDMSIDEVLNINKNTLKVFTKYGIDACCGSYSTIASESHKRKLDLEKILLDLNKII